MPVSEDIIEVANAQFVNASSVIDQAITGGSWNIDHNLNILGNMNAMTNVQRYHLTEKIANAINDGQLELDVHSGVPISF